MGCPRPACGLSGKQVPLISHSPFPPVPGPSSGETRSCRNLLRLEQLPGAPGLESPPLSPPQEGAPSELQASPSPPSAPCSALDAGSSFSLLSSRQHTGAWLPAGEEVAQTSGWEGGVTAQDSELCPVTQPPWQHRGGRGHTQYPCAHWGVGFHWAVSPTSPHPTAKDTATLSPPSSPGDSTSHLVPPSAPAIPQLALPAWPREWPPPSPSRAHTWPDSSCFLTASPSARGSPLNVGRPHTHTSPLFSKHVQASFHESALGVLLGSRSQMEL